MGFSDVAFTGCGPLQIEAINADPSRGFAGCYQGAVEAALTGSALVFYPN